MPITTKFCTAIRTTKYSGWSERAWQMEKSPYLSNLLTDHGEICLVTHLCLSLPLPPLNFPHFWNLRWRRPPSWKIAISRHWRMLILLTLQTIKKSNSKVAAANTVKNRIIALCQKPFDWLPLNLTQFEPLDPCDRWNFHILKIQNGGGRYFQKLKYCHISAMVWLIVTKFWHRGARWPSWPFRLLKIWNVKIF